MSDDKRDAPGPDEHKNLNLAIPDDTEDTEGHKKRVLLATGEPDGGPEEAKRKMSAIPDSDDDTVGHKK